MSSKGVDAKLGAKFKIENLNVDKLQTTTDGALIAEGSVKDIIPNLKVGFKIEEGIASSQKSKGSLNSTFTHDYFTAFSELNLTDGPTLHEAVSFEYQGLLAGAEIKYNVNAKDQSPITDLGATVGFKSSDFTTALQTSKKGKGVTFSLHHAVNSNTALAVLLDAETEGKVKSLIIGGTYKLDKETSFAGKINSNGEVTASFSQILKPSVKLVASAHVDTKNFAGDSHKFGLQVLLG